MNNIVHEDGQLNLYNDEGIAVTVVEMEVDEETYPIETVTNFGMYLDLKPPEKPERKTVQQSVDRDVNTEEDNRAPGIHRHYKDSEKEQLFVLIYERGMSVRAAVLKLQINPRTAQRWYSNDQQNPQTLIARKEGSGRPFGRPALLDDQPSLVLGATSVSKKRRTTGSGGPSQKQSKGTATGHYLNFLSDTMDVMDNFPDVFKDNDLIMDNAPIHMNEDIKSRVESHRATLVCLQKQIEKRKTLGRRNTVI